MIIRGTPKQLAEKYQINNLPLDQSMLSVLCRIGTEVGFAKVVEVVRAPGGKGKPASVWELSLPEEWNVRAKP